MSSMPRNALWDISKRTLLAIRDDNETMFAGRREAIRKMIDTFIEEFEARGYHE